MENVQRFIDDINNDLENRKRGLPTNPYEKFITFANLYPGVVAKMPLEVIPFEEYYFPENTRDKIDVQNKKAAMLSFEQIKKDNSFRQDTSLENASIKKIA